MTCLDYTASNSTSPLIPQNLYAPYSRSLVRGVGLNDSATPTVVSGKPTKPYVFWRNMLARCYAVNVQKVQPTYKGCSVSKEWHSFKNFEKWFLENYTEGYDLDKDILFSGNRVYSLNTCVFVPRELNSMLTDSRAARGDCPLGVSFHKRIQKYQARVGEGTGRKHLGYFKTALEGHKAWQLAKADVIEAFHTDDPRIRAALDLRVAQLRDNAANGRITTKL